MEKQTKSSVTELCTSDLENINGGIVPAIYAAYFATQYAVAVYGATKVSFAVGTVAGAATYAYVKS